MGTPGMLGAEEDGRDQGRLNKYSFMHHTKAVNAAPPKDMQAAEARVYNNLGQIALRGGTKESAKLAMGYFEKCRDIFQASGATTGVASVEASLALPKATYEGGSAKGKKELLKKYQKAYQQRVETFGQESSATINAGISLLPL